MPAGKRIIEELSKVADGASSALSGLKNEIETLVRRQIERFLADADVVPREEFDAVKEMAAKARLEQEKLAERVAHLEARLESGPAKRTRSTSTRKTAAKGPAAKGTAAKGTPGKGTAGKT